jgi:hypothetical protein
MKALVLVLNNKVTQTKIKNNLSYFSFLKNSGGKWLFFPVAAIKAPATSKKPHMVYNRFVTTKSRFFKHF